MQSNKSNPNWDISPANLEDMWSNNSACLLRKGWGESEPWGSPNNPDAINVWGPPPISPSSRKSTAGGLIWQEVANSAKDLMVENCKNAPIGPSGDSVQSSISVIQTNKRGSRTGPSLGDLNAVLNTLNNGVRIDGLSTELDDIVKALINVNDSWGQRPVDQSLPWDTSSIPVSTDECIAASPASSVTNIQTSTMLNSSNISQTYSSSTASGQMLSQFSSSSNHQRRVNKTATQGSMESNVWSHEPPNGTGIWEAHYESLGERTAHWQAAAANASVPQQTQFNSSLQPKIQPFVRHPSASTQAHAPTQIGIFRPVAITSTWDQSTNSGNFQNDGQTSQARWSTPNDTVNRPMSKNSIMPGNQRAWSNGQTAPDQCNTFISNQHISVPQTSNNWSRMNVNKFTGSNNHWHPSEYPGAPVLQHPPPSHPASSGAYLLTGPRMTNQSNSQIPQYQGVFRQNVMRQLVNMGFSDEEIKQTLLENNMDLEKTITDLREKSGHIGLDSIINAVSGFSIQQHMLGSSMPEILSNAVSSQDFNRLASIQSEKRQHMSQQHHYMMMLNNNPQQTSNNPINEITILLQREQQTHNNIGLLQTKLQELTLLQQSMINNSANGNQTTIAELSQQMNAINKQIMAKKTQNVYIRNQIAQLRNPNSRPISGGGMLSNTSSNTGSGAVDSYNERMYNELRLNQPPLISSNGNWNASVNSLTVGKSNRIWLLLRDMPPHASVELLKYSVITALASLDQNTPRDYEMHPNISARWCLFGFSNQLEVQTVIKLITLDRARFGIFEMVSSQEALSYLQDIQNLGRSFANPRWVAQSNKTENLSNAGCHLETETSISERNSCDPSIEQGQSDDLPSSNVDQIDEVCNQLSQNQD